MKTSIVVRTLFGIVAAMGSVACGAAGMSRTTISHASGMSGGNASAASAFDEGVAAFDRGELARAASAFEMAYRSAPNPLVAFNLGRVHERMSHPRIAANYYLAFLAGDVSPDRTLSVEARDALGRLRIRLALVRMYAPSGAIIDGESIAPSGYERWVAVDPGLRLVEAADHTRVALRAAAGDVLAVDCPRESGAIVVGTATFGAPSITARVATAEPR